MNLRSCLRFIFSSILFGLSLILYVSFLLPVFTPSAYLLKLFHEFSHLIIYHKTCVHYLCLFGYMQIFFHRCLCNNLTIPILSCIMCLAFRFFSIKCITPNPLILISNVLSNCWPAGFTSSIIWFYIQCVPALWHNIDISNLFYNQSFLF